MKWVEGTNSWISIYQPTFEFSFCRFAFDPINDGESSMRSKVTLEFAALTYFTADSVLFTCSYSGYAEGRWVMFSVLHVFCIYALLCINLTYHDTSFIQGQHREYSRLSCAYRPQ